MLVEFGIHPTDTAHMSGEIARIVEVLENSGIEYRLGPMGTAVEGDWDQVMAAIRKCHKVATENHTRVITTIMIDDQKDQPHHLDEMVLAVERHLGRPTKRVEQSQEA
jgi:uncharacterized protein (TIGR00106 family)